MKGLKVALQQRVIPEYRVPFLEKLASQPQIDLSVFSGNPHPREMIQIPSTPPDFDYTIGNNWHFFDRKFYFCLQPGLKRWLHEKKPQIVILEANPRYLSSRFALSELRKKRIGLIGWGLGVPAHAHSGLFSTLRDRLRLNYLEQFDAILAYSQTGRQQYIQSGILAEKVFVAANATAPRPASPLPEREPGFKNGQPTVLFVGRLQARKKVDSLIRICSQLEPELRPKLWIVGEGSVLPELQIEAETYLPETVFWGAQFGNDLKSLFEQADLFVLPGTGGLAIQEAMASALPVIVAEGDGTQSNLVNEETGWLVSPNDEEALLSALQIALRDPLKLRKMGSAAYRKVAGEVNIDQMAEVFAEIILKVAQRKEMI